MRSSERPTASSARWPSRCSAPALHDVITPSVSATTMPVRAVAVIPMPPSSTRGARPSCTNGSPISPEDPSCASPPFRHPSAASPSSPAPTTASARRRPSPSRARRRRRARHVPADRRRAPIPGSPTAYAVERAAGADARPGRHRRPPRSRPSPSRSTSPTPAPPAGVFDEAERQLGPVSILVNNASGWLADTFAPDAVDRLGRALATGARRRRSTATSASTPAPAPC